MSLHSDLSLDVLRQKYIDDDKNVENYIFSPLSFQTLMYVLGLAASGTTRTEMMSKVDTGIDKTVFEDNEKFRFLFEKVGQTIQEIKEKDNLAMVNFLFTKMNESEIEPQFKKSLIEGFSAQTAFGMDFLMNLKENVDVMNAKVKVATNDCIEDLLQYSDFDSLTEIILINAFSYKQDWKFKFIIDNLTVHKFTTFSGNRIDIQLMTSSSTEYKYYESAHFKAKAVQIPYKNSDNSFMLVLLPHSSTKEDFDEMVGKISSQSLHDLLAKMKSGIKVNLYFPKFKVAATTILKDLLISNGIKKMFNSDEANLRNIAKKTLYVSKIDQKAILEFNEIGTFCAASTAAVIKSLGFSPKTPSVEFKADKSFMFFQVNVENNIIKYMYSAGWYTDPKMDAFITATKM